MVSNFRDQVVGANVFIKIRKYRELQKKIKQRVKYDYMIKQVTVIK